MGNLLNSSKYGIILTGKEEGNANDQVLSDFGRVVFCRPLGRHSYWKENKKRLTQGADFFLFRRPFFYKYNANYVFIKLAPSAVFVEISSSFWFIILLSSKN